MVRQLLVSTPFKIASAYAALFFASTVALLTFIYVESQGEFEEQLRDRIREETKTLVKVHEDGGLARLQKRLEERDGSDGTSGFYYAVENERDGRLAGNLPKHRLGVGWHETSVLDDPGDPEDHEHTTLSVLGTRLPDGTLLAVGASQEHAEDLQEIIVEVAGLGLGLAALLAITGGLLMSRTALKRVSSINLSTDRIIRGDLSERLPINGSGDELDQLSDNINIMLVRIEQLVATTKQVSSDIAHELRTPLTRMVQIVETARIKSETRKLQVTFGELQAELDSILETFDALLRIGQLDARASGTQLAPIDLSALVSELADTYEAVALEFGHTLQTCIAQGIDCQADKQLLSQMLANLIENAIKHCPSGSRIRLHLRKESGRPLLTVEDNGPGIPPSETENVFRPFARLGGGTNADGKGLGLPLVAAIARQHDIDIQLKDNKPGLIVSLSF